MKDFVSDVKKIPHDAERVFASLSDLNNIGKIKDSIPQDKVRNLVFDTDSCSFEADKVGTISVRIIEREPYKTIKMVTEKSPVPFTLWIQLVEANPDDTRIRLTLRADIPAMFLKMVSGTIKEGIDKVADALAALPY